MQNTTEVSSGATRDADIAAFQAATRDLIDLAIRSVDAVAPGVSLRQMRLMMALFDAGPMPLTHLARTLGVAPSSVSRMIDRLVRAGLVDRSGNPANRAMVTLTLTDPGRETVRQVVAWRHAEWERLLSPISPDDLRAAARALGALHDGVAGTSASGQSGGLPL